MKKKEKKKLKINAIIDKSSQCDKNGSTKSYSWCKIDISIQPFSPSQTHTVTKVEKYQK